MDSTSLGVIGHPVVAALDAVGEALDTTSGAEVWSLSDVHHDGWQVAMAADRHPEFVPPPWVDPDQTPRRNTRPRYEHHNPAP
ncbi:MAG: hypothetical protein ACRDVO_15435 [Jiangellaceae bacterium]